MKAKNLLMTASLSLLAASMAVGQQTPIAKSLLPTNFGLTVPQDSSVLPKSTVPVVMPERKAKRPAITKLNPAGEQTWKIEGGWEMTDAHQVTASQGWMFDNDYNTDQWYNATVPGTVLTTLVNEGVYPDPYYGLNNLAIPETLCRQDWWYRTEFSLPADASGKKVWLLFNGINYRADVWLNGKLLGNIAGAFTRGEFELDNVKPEGNILAVHIYPPYNPGIPHEQSKLAGRGPNGGQLCLDGPTFISSEGWDWIPGIRDRNIGIWQDVLLRYTENVSLVDPQIITDLPLPDTTSANVTVRAMLTNNGSKAEKVTVKGEIGDITFNKEVTVAPGKSTKVEFTPAEFPQLNMQNPLLWWPNGYGPQNLYTLKLTAVSADGGVSDTYTTRFGVRELSYEMTIDSPGQRDRRVEFNPIYALKSGKPIFDNLRRRQTTDGVTIACLREGVDPSLVTDIADKDMDPYLVIKVNGERIFCKGGNWGMDDGMKRVSRERLEPYFRLHKEANFTMVRNWTGESTEELFYELCDEYGMLVWNDFWLTTEGSGLNANDENLFVDNATETIKRFRNHPSIAIWGPRNEGYAVASLEERLAELVAKEDGTRFYQANSRYMNLKPSGPWHYYKDAANYYRHDAKGFNTELGSPSVPTAESMRKMMPEADQWPISDTWYYHDLHFGLVDYVNAVDSLYGKATSLDDFCRKVQMINYDSYRAMFESWNSKLWNNTSGVLLWMSHPAWPSVEWQVYSWDYETFGSFFGSMKACEPVHIQMNLDNNVVAIINNNRTDLGKVKATLICYTPEGKQLMKKEQTIDNVAANSLKNAFTADLSNMQGVYLARVILTDAKGKVLSTNDYWKAAKGTKNFFALNDLPATDVKAKLKKVSGDEEKKITFEVSNPTRSTAVGVKLNLRNTDGEIILPAYFSDGYFNLLPGEKKEITVAYSGEGPVTVTTDGYNIKPLTILTVNK